MSIALYIDENVARQVTTGLRLRDVDVLTVQEDERTGYPDEIIFERANELNRVLFSQDDDFLVKATRLQIECKQFSGVIYAHKLRVSIGDCVRDLEIIAKACNYEDFINHVEYLPL